MFFYMCKDLVAEGNLVNEKKKRKKKCIEKELSVLKKSAVKCRIRTNENALFQPLSA